VNSYRYRVTLERLANAKGDPVTAQSFSFYATNHDCILANVDKLRTWLWFAAGTAASRGGLRLFSEVALTDRNDPLFAVIRPALSRFIKQLKQVPAIAD
jgi:hypothetical protein